MNEPTSNKRPVDSVAIVSGGMDSVTMLYALKRDRGYTPLVLSFDYGQKHKKELQFAKWHADNLGLEHRVINLGSVTQLLSRSALVGQSEVPDGHYADEVMRQTVVPNRNMMMLSIAAAACVNYEGGVIGIGVHAGDHPIYPDCRPDFIYAVENTINIGNDGFTKVGGIEVWAPFLNLEKWQIVARADTLDIDLSQTWSCYKGDELHCGTCGTCVERKEAFDIAIVPDPTKYSHQNAVG